MWTGHKKPQDSGSNFLTVVVRSSAKYAPRCTDLKWEIYLQHARVSGCVTGLQEDNQILGDNTNLRRINWI